MALQIAPTVIVLRQKPKMQRQIMTFVRESPGPGRVWMRVISLALGITRICDHNLVQTILSASQLHVYVVARSRRAQPVKRCGSYVCVDARAYGLIANCDHVQTTENAPRRSLGQHVQL